MSEKFTASNGLQIRVSVSGYLERMNPKGTREWDKISGISPNADKVYSALREFFLHERDQELGRWRWPEDLNYVVYKDGTSRRVVCESTGQMMPVSQHDRKVMTTYLESYVGAARAYDAAHPFPKPWHDANPGEVWALTVDGKETAFTLHGDLFRTGALWDIEQTDRHITAGRRIWPEVVES